MLAATSYSVPSNAPPAPNSFYVVAAFLFFIAFLQCFLNSMPRAAAGFALFGAMALIVGWVLPNPEPDVIEGGDNPKP